MAETRALARVQNGQACKTVANARVSALEISSLFNFHFPLFFCCKITLRLGSISRKISVSHVFIERNYATRIRERKAF